MTGRERMEAAFSPSGSPEPPFFLCYQGIVIRDHWDELTTAPWWHRIETNLERQIAWRREALPNLRVDGFDLPVAPSRRVRESFRFFEEHGKVFKEDMLSGERELLERPRVSGWVSESDLHSVQVDQLPDSFDEIEALIPLPPEQDLDAAMREGAGDLADMLLEDVGAGLYPMGYVPSPFWRVYHVFGFEGMMELLVTRPALVRHAAERYFEHSLAGVQLQARVGVKAFWIEECLTDMISPESYKTLNLPLLQRLIQAIRDAGCRSIYYFCGNPAGKWDLIESVGADALSLEEGKKGFEINIDDVVTRAAGRYVVLGNLDAVGVLQDGGEVMLEAEVRRQLAAGRRNSNRFIMSVGSPVTPGTSLARMQQFADLVRSCKV